MGKWLVRLIHNWDIQSLNLGPEVDIIDCFPVDSATIYTHS
jgi:hypothetical protein